MKLTILGGGGFRVPLVYGALLADPDGPVTEVALYDTGAGRLKAVTAVLEQQAAGVATAPRLSASTELAEALRGADFVFSAIRVGGLRGRTIDERVALDLGVLGQETTGPGGLAYALRTVPVALEIARATTQHAPGAWFINFTNPAGIVTEALQPILGDRVVGICDSPIGLARRAMHALRLDPASTTIDYVGLNHLGWLRGLESGGSNRLPELLADAARLEQLEEGRLFGPQWLQALGAMPNEYLYYYYYTREALASIRGAEQTRGEYLLEQQHDFYDDVAKHPDHALATWQRVRADREATYMRESRAEGEQRDAADVAGGGYEGVALDIMEAVSRGRESTMILNLRAGGGVGLDADAVVETPCIVGANGPVPQPVPPAKGHMLGLMQSVKAVERLVIEAVNTGSAAAAWEAFSLHPLVDSVNTGKALLDGYRRASPEVDAVFDR
ncbi:6-phospho-beta-glucosidase [Nakamurella aerolata]|uniref:6-phospho-beta-glucosidase n=1 Tax=Nakamurella aerolata TaxID=1656892 RepID=A0A849A8K0_9ACTN|nr:6-phospho-beta-glucosidase [Nakamurella aerolata]NNG36845.1 6-phospho-beta-glucosidase [Nakamurella aerolata]